MTNSPSINGLSIKHLNLSTRTSSALIRAGIYYIGQLSVLTDTELLSIKNIGVTAVSEIHQTLLKLPQANFPDFVAVQQEKIIDWFPDLQEALTYIQNFPLIFLTFSNRTANALRRARIYTLGDLLLMNEAGLLQIQNFGEKSISEAQSILSSLDLTELQKVMSNLELQGHEPAKLPLSCLMLLHRTTYRTLSKYGVENLEHLCAFNISELKQLGIQENDIHLIQAMLRAYGLSLCGASPISNGLVKSVPVTSRGKGPEDHIVHVEESFEPKSDGVRKMTSEKQDITISDALRSFLSQIDLRQAEVLQLRYGLEGREEHTLAEIGQKLNLTRERVRQIEQKAIRHLQHPRRRLPFEPFIQRIRIGVQDAGGALSVYAASQVLLADEGGNSYANNSLMSFVLLFAPDIKFIKQFSMLSLDYEPYTQYAATIDTICLVLKRSLQQALAPISSDAVLARLKADTDGKTISLYVPDSFLLACLRAHPDIVVDEDGLYGLRQWANKRIDDIIAVLRQRGEAIHYSEITKLVNLRLPAEQQATAHNIHAQIGRLPDMFVRVGHGIFGLAEWGLKQDRSLADAAYRVLRETNYALDIEQLTDRVLETWQVKRSSIRAAVDLDGRFVQVGRNLYWLAEAVSPHSVEVPANDFETLFGEALLRRGAEFERDLKTKAEHDSLEEFRRLKSSIFD